MSILFQGKSRRRFCPSSSLCCQGKVLLHLFLNFPNFLLLVRRGSLRLLSLCENRGTTRALGRPYVGLDCRTATLTGHPCWHDSSATRAVPARKKERRGKGSPCRTKLDFLFSGHIECSCSGVSLRTIVRKYRDYHFIFYVFLTVALDYICKSFGV